MKYSLLVVIIYSTIVVGSDSAIAKKHHKLKRQDTVITSNDVVAKDTLQSSNVNESSGNSTALYVGLGLIILLTSILYFRKRNRTDVDPKSDFVKNQSEPETRTRQELPDIEVDTSHGGQSLEQALGIIDDASLSRSQKHLISVILRSLNSYHSIGSVISLSGIDGEKNKDRLRRLLIDAVVSDGGLTDFLQVWFVGSFKNEVVLLGANKYSIAKCVNPMLFIFEQKKNPSRKMGFPATEPKVYVRYKNT